MCDAINPSNFRELEAKYEGIKSHRTLAEPHNACQFLEENFLESLDSVILAGLKLSVLPQLIYFAFNIETLDLSHNCLRILREHGKPWRRLRYMDLSDNQFLLLPSIAMKLSTLRYLSVSSNNLEFIPRDWSSLYNLEELDLSYNRIVDISPLVNIQSLKVLNLNQNMISVLPYDIHKLENLLSLNCQQNRIYHLPNSLAQMKMLEEFDVLDNPLVFPPFNIISRGLAHILAFLSRNEQKPQLHPPPLQQQQYEEEEDLVEEVAEETSSSLQNPISPPATLLPSPTASRPSSAMAMVTWQQIYLPTTPDRTESSQSERNVLRRLSSQPEFYRHVATASGDTDDPSVSPTSLSEDGTSIFELHQSCDSQQLWREGHHGKTYSSYPVISHKPQEMNQERYRLFTEIPDKPQPPPPSALPSSNAGRSKLYVRGRTPSPPPRRPRPSVSLSRSPDASIPCTRPLLHPRHSISPFTHSPYCRLPDEPSQAKATAMEFTRVPIQSRQASKTSAEVSEDSEDDLLTDSSCEDLPVPPLRNHLPSSATPSPSIQHHSTRRPGQSIAPTAASLQQHHRYRKHGRATGPVHPKANPSLLHQQQRAPQAGRRSYRSDQPNEALSPPHPVMTPSHKILRSPQPLYPQTHRYDELWRSTAEALRMILVPHLNTNLSSTPFELANELKTGIHLADFLNNFLGYKAIKKIYEVSGSSWRFRARQNLFSCREVIHNVGVPKHRLFSVTRVLAADTTVGLFGLLHCLQTLLEVWASRPSTFIVGGLGVREKLSNQPTSYRSLLGDITTNRHLHHQQQQRYRHRTFSNPNYGVGVNGYGGVFSDV
uniref:Leucine rich repeat and calponin y n=1 Tax=Echinococcus granulosus TaxID=6210 RepID=A0A068WN66_ECHGR|nr:leucine rich repeat and calponin y [Echinococcus granulosus]